MTVYDILADAIEKQKQIHATYKGLRREMCPHVLGVKNGKMNCLFYQFGGESSSREIVPGSTQNWRCVNIEKLEDVIAVEGEWYSANNHSREQTCVDEIHASVEY